MHLFDEILAEPDRLRVRQDWVQSANTKTKRQAAYRKYRQLAVRDLLLRQLETRGRTPPTVSAGLARELAEAFDWLSQGYANPLVTPATKNSGARTPPPLRRCQITALVYLRLAHDGVIDDTKPMKTITEAFGVSRPSVRLWQKQLKSEVPSAMAVMKRQGDSRLSSKLGADATAYRSWRKQREFTASLATWPRHFRGMRANRVIA